MKKVYESKTIIFFVLFALVQVAGLLGYADYTPSGDEAEWIQLGVALIGLVLRGVTSKGVEL
jgi:hypothetical protein